MMPVTPAVRSFVRLTGEVLPEVSEQFTLQWLKVPFHRAPKKPKAKHAHSNTMVSGLLYVCRIPRVGMGLPVGLKAGGYSPLL